MSESRLNGRGEVKRRGSGVSVAQDGTISYEDPDALSMGGGTPGSPAACSDAHTDKDEEQAGTWKWYLGDGVRPAGLTTTQTADALKQAVGWIETSHNDCGYADQVSADAVCQGVSSLDRLPHRERRLGVR